MRPWIWFRYFPVHCTALIDVLIAPDSVKHEPGEIVSAFLTIPGTNPYGYSREIFIKIDNYLLLGYPVAELLSHREANSRMQPVMIAGYYCLPFLLYVILSVVAIDLGILLLRILRILRPDTTATAGFRFVRLGGCLILPALIVLAGA